VRRETRVLRASAHQQLVLDERPERIAHLSVGRQSLIDAPHYLHRNIDTPHQAPTGTPDHRSGVSRRHTDRQAHIDGFRRWRADSLRRPVVHVEAYLSQHAPHFGGR
jgi:hypothetical protein